MNHSMTATPQTGTSSEFSESALLQSAVEFHGSGQYGVARQLYLQILEQNPGHEVAWHNLGLVEHMTGRHAQAAEYIGKAVALKPDYARAYANLAAVLRETRQFEAARETAERAIRLEPGFAPAYNNLGGILEDLGETDPALAAYLEACRLDPFFIEAHTSAAEILRRLAVTTKRSRPASQFRRSGPTRRGRISPPATSCVSGFGSTKPPRNSSRPYRSIPISPRLTATSAICCSSAAISRARFSVYEKALAIKPDFAEIHCNLGAAYESLRRPDDAMNSYARAVALDPSLVGVRLQLLHMRRALCDWTGDEAEEVAALAAAAVSDRAVPPFGPLAMNSGHALQLDLARRWARAFHAKPRFDHRRRLPDRRRKLRIGYLSGDFFRHATAILMAGLFEQHDRARFEIIAYSHGEDDGSELRHRLFKAFDRFIDITAPRRPRRGGTHPRRRNRYSRRP